MTPSTTQSAIDDMADLVMSAPGERVAIMTLLHKAIQDRMALSGMSEEERHSFWVEDMRDIKQTMLYRRSENV